MAVTNGKLEAQITVPSTTNMISVTDSAGAFNLDIPAGTWWVSSIGSLASEDLVGEFEDQLRAKGAADNWSVTCGSGENGTGLVTIANPDADGAWGIAWDGGSDPTNGVIFRNILGFTGNITNGAGSGEVATNHIKFLWLPDAPLQSRYGNQTPLREADARTTVSPAGHVKSLYGQRRAVYELSWFASRAKTFVQGESTTGESYEQFWIDGVLGENAWATVGGPVRIHWDADNDLTYTEVRYQEFAQHAPEPIDEQWTGLYRISTGRLIEVP